MITADMGGLGRLGGAASDRTGRVMKQSRGKANPALAQELLKEKLGSP